MAQIRIGSVAALFRYPVKSMLGERADELAIGPAGALGDRTWALRELASGRIVSAKKWSGMFGFSSSHSEPPEHNPAAPVRITMPDGRTINADDPAASSAISAALGHQVRLERADAGKNSRAIFEPASIFGDAPLEQILPSLQKYMMERPGPDDFALRPGTFFDAAPLHLLADKTLDHLARLSGLDAFDVRRFRPNIFIAAESVGAGFVEDEWLGAQLEIGSALKIAVIAPVIRCVMTTHAQSDLPRELGVLRAAAAHHAALVGVYGAAVGSGRLRVGDPVTLLLKDAA